MTAPLLTNRVLCKGGTECSQTVRLSHIVVEIARSGQLGNVVVRILLAHVGSLRSSDPEIQI